VAREASRFKPSDPYRTAAIEIVFLLTAYPETRARTLWKRTSRSSPEELQGLIDFIDDPSA
jgi:hypothetical protein